MTMAIDIFLIILLVLAIGYGFVLNRRIVALRKDQKNLEHLAASFNTATSRAESGVAQLKSATENAVVMLQDAISKAAHVRGDLEYLLERGERTADRLEGAVRSGEQNSSRQSRVEAGEMAADEEPVRSNEERELLKALRAVR
ncbi:MAG: hypothetical protein HQ503_13660 [Rhodospirillales bacterium]|nr:hypothetical protein [Rhodospirillales bacterium]